MVSADELDVDSLELSDDTASGRTGTCASRQGRRAALAKSPDRLTIAGAPLEAEAHAATADSAWKRSSAWSHRPRPDRRSGK